MGYFYCCRQTSHLRRLQVGDVIPSDSGQRADGEAQGHDAGFRIGRRSVHQLGMIVLAVAKTSRSLVPLGGSIEAG